MAREQLTNGVTTTLAAPLDDSANEMTLTSLTGLPTTGYYRGRIDDEIIGVVASDSQPLPIHRGLEDTTATSHVNGAAFKQVLTAGALYAIRSVYDVDAIEIRIDGGGSAIGTGVKWRGIVPCDMTLTGWIANADQAGSIVVDLWVEHQDDYPPTDADSITAAAPITLTTTDHVSDDGLTDWILTLTAGQAIWANVDSCDTITQAVILLTANRDW